jgi:L-alanine-DL-glutamate epimerase-like enolase superfamily enzyme
MRIAKVTVTKFRYTSRVARDAHGHGHPGPEREATQSLLTIETDDGASGHYFGAVDPDVIKHVVEPDLLGQHALYRERLWHELKESQRLHLSTLGDRVLTAVDLALWDLAGNALASPYIGCWAPRATTHPRTPARWWATTSRAAWIRPRRMRATR